jgi:predicted RNA-binding Zn-ribbon protein involved in translation (DUF1610 family)
MDQFRVVNRCPMCGGNAISRYHRSDSTCSRMSGPHMHHRCEDCGFSWGERPVDQPTIRRQRLGVLQNSA